MKIVVVAAIFCIFLVSESVQQSKPKKNLVDMTDAEIEKLAEEWDKDEEELPEDEKPLHERKNFGQPIDVQNFLKSGNPGEAVKMFNKKNKPMMIFVEVNKKLNKLQAEEKTKLWATSLFNAHYEVNRFMVDDHQAIFMINDGSKSWEIKDYLIQQKDCNLVTIDQDKYPGKYADKSEL
ncbi:LDLR chaperone boca [Brachionus plicatilis]|uniref:LDLR chaperone boca n=1 Tax=Brachionus plicatilis TaxID=10195 RepID=A0A3M7PNH7_BRAPC|nr:LDLR chaperone boca [Brachionus plicatilis]